MINLKSQFKAMIEQKIAHLETKIHSLNFTNEIQANSDRNNLEDLLLTFLNISNKFIPNTERKIEKSRIFYCPKKYRKSLKEIENKMKKGEDLSPHLSRGIGRAYHQDQEDNNDAMLNAWNIHHLHLSNSLDSDGFVTRTKHVLFAMFSEDKAYLIAIKRHGSRSRGRYYTPWSLQIFLKVLYQDWPESLEGNVSNLDLDKYPTDIETYQWRRGNINTLTNLGYGKSSFSTLTLSGHSQEDVRLRDHILSSLESMQNCIHTDYGKILLEISRFHKVTELDLHLINFEVEKLNVTLVLKDYNTESLIIFRDGCGPLLKVKRIE